MATQKAIILAGGSGTRLYPCTRVLSKQLMPIYNKPMIYYSLSTIMLSGIRDILIISTPRDLPLFQQLLSDGSQWGLNLSYAEQPHPKGLADSFIIGEKFIGRDPVAMILGDNLFYGQGLDQLVKSAAKRKSGATVFAYRVNAPERYGVMVYDERENPIGIIEKPKVAPSNWAVTGLYFYDNDVIDIAKTVKPSARGELEITDINNVYIQMKRLNAIRMGRGFAWLDTGTHESMAMASEFMRIIEERQNMMIGCPEEIAYNFGYINDEQVLKIAASCGQTPYADYLKRMVEGGK